MHKTEKGKEEGQQKEEAVIKKGKFRRRGMKEQFQKAGQGSGSLGGGAAIGGGAW